MPEQLSERSRRVVGLISGTSMDGIDAALVHISGPATQPRVRLLAFETLPYEAAVRKSLLRIAAGEPATAGEISQLNFLLGELFAEAALGVCRKSHIPASGLEAIGSHGQTIYHHGAPTREGGRSIASTLQIAEPAVIAERTGAPVVADFRTADMAAGGQGAPLVPMVDYLLLRDLSRGTVALNIGGIANFTVIPAGAEPEQVFGFDTGPGNMIIDGLVRHFTKGQKTYDDGGEWAVKGQVIEPLLDEMLRFPFFAQQPPKSAGREQFGQPFIEQFFLARKPSTYTAKRNRVPREPSDNRQSTMGEPGRIDHRQSSIGNHPGARPEDLVRTATELTARTIADALERLVPGKIAVHRLIISGGGAHNNLLVARLGQLLPRLSVQRSSQMGLDVDAKEAIVFAVLADRTMHGLPGNLPGVTGARRPVLLGKIVRP